jgi:acetyl-CoA C-acetyltransferase
MTKYSAGIYSTAPVEWRPDRSAEIQAEIDTWPAPEHVVRADGRATIETCTVTHSREGARTGIVVGRLDDGGARFLARNADGDDTAIDLLTVGEPVGKPVHVRSFAVGNRFSTSDEGRKRR